MTRLKYLDPADGQYKLLPVGGGGGGGAEEVVISAGVTPTKSEELWVDTSATAPIYDWSTADNRYLSSGFRNVIRNGDMSISQRGNGPFPINNYGVDGWIFAGVGGTMSQTRTLPAAGGASPWLSTVVSGQSAAGDYCQIVAVIEDVNTLNGKAVTISFDAWCASGTPKVALEIQQLFGTGGTPSASQNIPVSAVTISTTRTRYSVNFTIPSVAGASLGTNGNSALRLAIWFSSGSTYAVRASNIGIQSGTFHITDVQMEAGSAATAFERLPIQQQLDWCQRYFYRISPGLNGGAAAGQVTSTTTSGFLTIFPTAMRAAPSFSQSALADWGTTNAAYSAAYPATNMGAWNTTPVSARFFTVVASGLVAANATQLHALTAGAYLDFTAEI